MNKNVTSMFVLALALVLAAPGARAQDADTISVPLSDPSKPASLEVGLVAGSIEVEGYDGSDVLVTAAAEMEAIDSRREKRRDGLRRIPNTSSGMTVEEKNNRVHVSVESWNRAVKVVVKVPRRTSLKLTTVNEGDIEVRGVEGELELGNTNGSIEALDVSGSVVAHTINGEVKVTFKAVTPDKAMSFSNLNGDIDVTLPSDVRAHLLLRSDMGEILTDFDIETVSKTRKSNEGGEGKGFRVKIEKQVEAKLNGGGPEFTFKNFNGDILIRKGS